MTNEDARMVYDRLRETERETAIQNQRLADLSERVDSMLRRWDSQMDRMWRIIAILVGALIALALGPKVAEKVMAAGTSIVMVDLVPWHPDDLACVS